ncbi:MAG: hypothetical protein EBS05_08205 [Proteobacteria bacterium]|nr:hypothetical protein [Pseudomonadota bacterium]
MNPSLKKPFVSFLRRTLCASMLTALLPAVSPTLPAEEAAQSRVNALVKFEFSDSYLTPRGMIVQNEGLVFMPLVLGFANVYKSDDILSDVTVVGGVWNCFGSARINASGAPGKTSWYEIDPIAGLSFGLGKKFKLDVTYTAFDMQILNIPFSHHLETKLSFDDTEYLKEFALHPQLIYWQELDGKATNARLPYSIPGLVQTGPGSVPNSSYYFDFAIDPGYTFDSTKVKLEAPCRILLPSKDFYGEFYKSASTVGLYEVGVKASMPMNFMPKGYGNWSCYAGFRYMGFVDKNLQQLNAFNATGKPETGATQVYLGVSSFF